MIEIAAYSGQAKLGAGRFRLARDVAIAQLDFIKAS